MNKSFPTLIFISLTISGCLEGSGNNHSNEMVFENIDIERLYYLYIDSSIERIVVDVDFVGDRAPSELSLDAIRSNLETLAPNRLVSIPAPTRVSVDYDSRERIWTYDEFYNTAIHNRDFYGDDAVTVHVLILNGKNEYGMGVEGFFDPAANTIAFFPDASFLLSLDEQEFDYPAFYEIVERGIIVHELGHALGLVNNGAPMKTNRLPSEEEDPCQCHSTEEDSPMYYSTHGPWILEKIEENKHIPFRFTPSDLADIQAFKDIYS